MIDQKDVTIIIPHLGATKEQKFALKECLTSLRNTVPKMKKIIVFNNGMDEESDEIFDPGLNEFVIVLSEQGQCKAVNAGVATVNTPWIFVTNDDMIYAEGWFDKLTENIGTIACISPNLVEPQDGAPPFLKKFCGGAGGDFDMECWLEFTSRNHEDNKIETGFNLPFLIKKDLWDMIGGYDVNYDPLGSNGDSDLQAKIHLAGEETYRNRNSIVYHFSQTSGTFHPDNRSYWQKNWNYFVNKWGFERQGDDQKVWYSKDLIDYDKLKYHPWWEEKWKKILN